MTDCILCYETQEIFGIGRCNHGPICYLCVIKCRTKLKNKQCPICKEELQEIIMSFGQQNYNEFEMNDLEIYGDGILFNDIKVKEQLDSLNQYKCWLPNCQDQAKFNTIGFLKRHLKEKHQRMMCDICLEFKTALLKEQKLYSSSGLDKHLKNGDYDEEGNLIFFHPFCSFCNKYFYNEEQFQLHMTKSHYSCHVCATDHKFRFYDTYQNLENHFNITHYLCQDPDCLQKNFVVFRSLAEFELHIAKVHANMYDKNLGKQHQKQMNNFNLQTIGGFHYEQNQTIKTKKQKEDEKIVIKDSEGVDMENEFISQRRVNVRNNLEKDAHKDETLDIRDFFRALYEFNENEDEFIRYKQIWKDAIELLQESYSNEKMNRGRQNQRGRGTARGGKQEQMTINKKLQQEDVFLDDIRIVKYIDVKQIDTQEFDRRLDKLLNQDQFERFYDARTNYFKGITTAAEFLNDSLIVFGKKLGLKLFPYFITTIPNSNTQEELDQVYYNELLKLPRKKDNIIYESKTYLQLINNVMKLVSSNIRQRIIDKSIDGKQKYKLDKSRIHQLIEILRYVKTKDMAKLKFATNFGIPIEMIDYIKHEMYFCDSQDIQQYLKKIPSYEILLYHLYLSLCSKLLQGNTSILFDTENKQKNESLLGEYLKTNPDLVEIIKKNQNESEDEYKSSDDDQPVKKLQEIPMYKKQVPIKQPEKKQEQVVPQKVEPKLPEKIIMTEKQKKVLTNDDVFEFPSLGNAVNGIPSNQTITTQLLAKGKVPQNQQLDKNNAWEFKKNQNPFLQYSKADMNVVLKEEFPTLDIAIKPQAKKIISSNWGDSLQQEQVQKAEIQPQKIQKAQNDVLKTFTADDIVTGDNWGEDDGWQEPKDTEIGRKGKGKNKKKVYAGGFF